MLKEVDVPIASSTDCRLAYDQLIEINPKQMICAGYPEGGKDACNGIAFYFFYILRHLVPLVNLCFFKKVTLQK